MAGRSPRPTRRGHYVGKWGDRAFASGGGSTITANGASIVTSGVSAPGVQADAGGLVTLNGGSVATTGSDAHGFFVIGAGLLATLIDTNVLNTSGNGAIGLYAMGGGVIDATGPTTISTLGTTSTSTGLGAFGVNADGAGSQINLAATDRSRRRGRTPSASTPAAAGRSPRRTRRA